MSEQRARKCVQCGAPALASAGRFCTYCGAELPSEESPLPPIPSQVVGARFERLRAIPEAAALIHVPTKKEPVSPPKQESLIPTVILACAFSTGAILIASTSDSRAIQAVAILILVVSQVFVGKIIFHSINLEKKKPTPEPSRVPVLVVDERIRVSGLQMTTTYNYATLQGEDGERTEYAIGPRLAGRIAVGDVGIASFAEKKFVDFQRFDA